jgi:uncharacterized protein YcaQ
MPILFGDRLIGRLDAAADRGAGVFRVLSVHDEPGAPKGAGPDIAAAVRDLARFTGTTEIAWPRALPRAWARALRAADAVG